METDIQKGHHVTHPEHGICEVLYEKHQDNTQIRIKQLDENLTYRNRKAATVGKEEVEIVEIGKYKGSDPISKDDYVTVDGGGLWRVAGLQDDDETVFKLRLEHVTTGEEKIVDPEGFSKPSKEIVEAHGYHQNCNGNIYLDWREHRITALIGWSRSSTYSWREGRMSKKPFTRKEVRRSLNNFWAYVDSKAPEGARLRSDFEEELEEIIHDNGDLQVEDTSFGYEYGSISGVEECYDAWVEFDATDVDVYVLQYPDELEEDGIEICIDEDDFEAYADISLEDLECEEVDIGGYTFYHVTGTIKP